MTNKLNLLITISLCTIFLLMGCTAEREILNTEPPAAKKSVEEHITRTELGTGEMLNIVHGYEGLADYVEAAQSESDPDFVELNLEHAIDPIRDVCTQEGEHWSLSSSFEEMPIRDLEYLTDGINELRESNIDQIVKEAVEASAEVFPMDGEMTACIFILDPRVTFAKEEMGGITGFSNGPGKFWLLIYPGSDWEDHTHYLVAHEYHHAVWFDRHYDLDQFDLLENMILEGRADTFAKSIYPTGLAPWTDALTDKQTAYQWDRIQDHLDASDRVTLGRWMFGYSGVTTWTGYTLGYNIVQSYIDAHPDVSVDELAAIDAETILAASGYDPSGAE